MSNFNSKNVLIAWTIVPALNMLACGKESKKEAASESPKTLDSESVETNFAPFPQGDKGKFGLVISSNQKDARFKCAVAPEQQRSLPVSQWVDCSSPWMIDVKPGQSYILRAKAVASNGKEDTTPAEYVAAIPAPVAPPTPPPQQPSVKPKVTIRTMILDKEKIPAEITDEKLDINFGFEAPGIDPAQIVYECKTQQHTTYQSCPDKTRYKFTNLKHGGEYRLKVRALVGNDKVQADTIEDEVSFKVNLTGGFVIANESALAGKTITTDTDVILPRSNRNLTCSLTRDGQSNAREEQCLEKYRIKVRDLGRGSFRFVVKGQQSDEASLAFCIEECSQGSVNQPDQGGGGFPGSGVGGGIAGGAIAGGGGVVGGGGGSGGYSALEAQTYQIGSFYGYTVLPGMHVVQYASTKNHAEVLNFFSVTNDPYAVGIYNCTGVVDRILTFLSPAKVPYTYCNSTPPREAFKVMTEGRLALNHLEVATDANEIQKNPLNHERIMINVFDSDYEFMINRGKFSSLCAENANARGRVTRSDLVPVIDRNFWGTWTNAQIFTCWGQFAEGPGIPTLDQQSGWWIGAFYISSNDNLPAYECYRNNWSYDINHPDSGANYNQISPQWCQDYRNPSLIEVVYMTKKPFQQDYLFMRELQSKFAGLLTELRPRLY
jgi:hypothetical protein